VEDCDFGGLGGEGVGARGHWPGGGRGHRERRPGRRRSRCRRRGRGTSCAACPRGHRASARTWRVAGWRLGELGCDRGRGEVGGGGRRPGGSILDRSWASGRLRLRRL